MEYHLWRRNTQQQNIWKHILIIALLIFNLIATASIAFYLFVPARNSSGSGVIDFDNVQNGQYILYIGTNDKDTYEQIIPTDRAKEIVSGICAKHVEGYTVSEAQGGWVDENNVLTQENNLVYSFYDVGEEEIAAIMREVLSALNQNSILVERRDVSRAFFSGTENPE